jgi:hypothetical protein
MQVHPKIRDDVLRYAARLTSDKHNPAAVVINASPILAWLEEASDEHDLRARCRALSRQHVDQALAHAEPDDNPERFLVAARAWYAFLSAQSGGEMP